MMYICIYHKQCNKFKLKLGLFFQSIKKKSPYLSQYGRRIKKSWWSLKVYILKLVELFCLRVLSSFLLFITMHFNGYLIFVSWLILETIETLYIVYIQNFNRPDLLAVVYKLEFVVICPFVRSVTFCAYLYLGCIKRPRTPN